MYENICDTIYRGLPDYARLCPAWNRYSAPANLIPQVTEHHRP
jgi:hypothetical protein